MTASSKKAAPAGIDAYLAKRPPTVRRVLEALRRMIQAAAPDAEESISYGMPAFRLHGRPLVAFGAASGHCAFYPMSPAVVTAHRDQLEAYSTSKGTIRFSSDRPLPAVLVKRLVRARVDELRGDRLPATAAPGRGGSTKRERRT